MPRYEIRGMDPESLQVMLNDLLEIVVGEKSITSIGTVQCTDLDANSLVYINEEQKLANYQSPLELRIWFGA